MQYSNTTITVTLQREELYVNMVKIAYMWTFRREDKFSSFF